MTNEELCQYLRESIRTEESAVRVYYKHIRSAILRSGIAEDKQRRIREILDKLGRESEHHRDTLEEMLNEIEGLENHDRK